MSATDQLMERVRKLVLDGDLHAIQRIVAGQVAINTQLETERTEIGPGYAERLATDPLFLAEESLKDCSEEVVKRTERIIALEAERDALWAFVRATDAVVRATPEIEITETTGLHWRAMVRFNIARNALTKYKRT